MPTRHESPTVSSPPRPLPPAPTLVFLCGTCCTPMQQVCHHCLGQQSEEQDQERRLEAEMNERAHQAHLKIDGVPELEELFAQEVIFDLDDDEFDGICWSASMKMPGIDPLPGSGRTEADAVDRLRQEIVKALRGTACHLEQPIDRDDHPLLLETSELADLLEVLEGKSGRPASIPAIAAKIRLQAGLPPLATVSPEPTEPLAPTEPPPSPLGKPGDS